MFKKLGITDQNLRWIGIKVYAGQYTHGAGVNWHAVNAVRCGIGA